jgi:hypothetical protein
MSSTSHTIVMVYGNEVFGENTRRVIEAVFGPCLDGDGTKSYVGETDPKPLAIVQPASSVAVPVALLAEVSNKLPELLFKVACYEAAKGLSVGVTYSAGKATGCPEAVALAARQSCDSQSAPAVPCESTVPTTLRAIAEQHFQRGYSYINAEIYTGDGIRLRDRHTMNEHFGRYEIVKALLDTVEREQCERTEQHYEARAVRAKAHLELREALDQFSKPEVSCLLDAEDRDTLKRLEAVLVKVAPNFKAEFGAVRA